MPEDSTPRSPLGSAAERLSACPLQQQTLYLLATALLWLVLSEPLNLVHGFLFAEEGTTYLRYAWLSRPWPALFAPHQQYFAAIPNSLALLEARVLPLSWAALCAAWIVLLMHLWLVYFVAQCERLTSFASRGLAVAVVLLAPGSASILVGSTQLQFVLAFMCCVVLVSDSDRHTVSRTVVVLLGGLNGVVSCMLTPFFLYRAWRDKSIAARQQAILLSICCLAQGLVLLHAMPFAGLSEASRSPLQYFNALTNHVLALPFLTRVAYHAVSQVEHGSAAAAITLAVTGCCGLLLLATTFRSADYSTRLLVFVAAFHACCSLYGLAERYADILGGGERYFYVANAAVGLALVLQWQRSRARGLPGRSVTVLLALLLCSGCVDLLRFWRLNQSGTPWAVQVRLWQADPAHATLTANPANWSGRMYLTRQPLRLDLPFYIYDSDTRPEALRQLPKRLFGPNPAGAE